MASFSAHSCMRILKTWRICLDIELCQLKNGYSSPTSMGTPTFFSSHCNELIISFSWETIYLSDFYCWKLNKENRRFTVVFPIGRLITMPRNLVQFLIKDSAFCLIQTQNLYLCPMQRIDCSLMFSEVSVTENYNYYWECVLLISIK